MDVLPRDVLQSFLTYPKQPCVSMYMPTEHVQSQIKQNPTRFKNLLSEAHEQLVANGMRSADAEEMLDPARQQVEDLAFWRNQSEGLAVYIAPDLCDMYRFPYPFKELCVVNNRFHVKELLPLMSNDGRFYVLALSQNDVRLLRGTHYRVDEVRLDNVPANLAEALRYDQTERHVRFHTETPGHQARTQAPMFHGQGYEDASHQKQDILRYFHKIDGGLHEFFRDERVPLILAGVDYLFPIYKEANTYAYLLDEGLPGNPEHTSDDELREGAWELVRPLFAQRQEDELARYQKLFGRDQLTAADPHDIIPAAYYQRIDSLFIPLERELWGTFDEDNNELELHEERQPGDEDLLDFAAVCTYLNGGNIFTLPAEKMPGEAAAAAIMRY